MLAGCGCAVGIPRSLGCCDCPALNTMESIWELHEISTSGEQSSSRPLLFPPREGGDCSKHFGLTDKSCPSHAACPVEASLSRVHVMGNGLILTFWLRPLPSFKLVTHPSYPTSHQSDALYVTLQLATGQGRGKPREQHKDCSEKRKKNKTFSFLHIPPCPGQHGQHSAASFPSEEAGSEHWEQDALFLRPATLNHTGFKKPSANAPLGQPAHPALLQKPALPSPLAYKGGCIITAF